MKQMYDLISLVTGRFGDIQIRDVATQEKLVRLRPKVTKLVEVKDKISAAIGSGGRKAQAARTMKE